MIKTVLMASALAFVGIASMGSALANPQRNRTADPRPVELRHTTHSGYDHRRNVNNGRIHYWRDSLGRKCYRRSDGVRRCN